MNCKMSIDEVLRNISFFDMANEITQAYAFYNEDLWIVMGPK